MLTSTGYTADLFVGFPCISGSKDFVFNKWEDKETVQFERATGIYQGPYVCTQYHLVESDNRNIYDEKLLTREPISPVVFSNGLKPTSDWTPSMTKFNGFFVVAYKQGGNNRIYYSWSQDGISWVSAYPASALSTRSSPRLQAFNGRVYLFFLGSQDCQYYTSTADGESWDSARYAGGASTQQASTIDELLPHNWASGMV